MCYYTTIPDVVTSADAELDTVTSRGSIESLETYYNRFKVSLDLATCVRHHINRCYVM